MIISVKVKTSASSNSFIHESENLYIATVTARPIEGEANKLIIKLISDFFSVPKTSVVIKSGQKSRTKLFEFPE